MTPWVVIEWCLVIIVVIGTSFVVAMSGIALWTAVSALIGEPKKKDARKR